MTRLRAMRDTLAFDIALLAIGTPTSIVALFLFTTNKGAL